MARLTTGERWNLTRLAVARAGRRAVSSTLRLPALRWWAGPAVADELIIVPQDLRTPDPSFLEEFNSGHFGLGGAVVDLGGHSPFALLPPSTAWRRELHGFGWLRNLRAAGGDQGRDVARVLAADWVARFGRSFPREGSPEVVARRVISWISQANLLLDGAASSYYVALTGSLGAQIHYLATSWRDAPAGQPRLLTLTALVLADLCVAGHERQLEREQRAFFDELERQILPDGGHVSRNPGVVADLLLDFLPLRQCYVARQRTVPTRLSDAIERMIGFLKYIRRGDGALARFNGMSRTEADALATVLAYDATPDFRPTQAPASRYGRLECGETTIIVDAGPPPPLELAGHAHAGCLSFEMSVGARVLLANCGAPGPAHEHMRAAARATASHNTLCLADRSSSRLVRARLIEQVAGAVPIRMPERVTARFSATDDGRSIEASHDGYLAAFGLIHERSIAVSGDGAVVQGRDVLRGARGTLRMSRDVPFAIHFHAHTEVTCRRADKQDTAILQLPGGAPWRLTATGARLSIESSLDYGHYSGPHAAQQVVLRGACPGESTVTWTLEQVRQRVRPTSTASDDAVPIG